MKDTMSKPVLTPDLSKHARRELGLSQRDVIAATGIQGYKLKQWEGRGLSIELADIRKLSDFYESKGVNLAELGEHVSRAQRSRAGATPAAHAELQEGFTYTPRPGFIISDQLAPSLVDKLMERMEANDDRIGELTQAAFKAGLLGSISDETEAKARELIAALAENHVIFRFLQGRNIIAPTRNEPKTLADYLSMLMQDSPALPLLTSTEARALATIAKSPTTQPAEAVEA